MVGKSNFHEVIQHLYLVGGEEARRTGDVEIEPEHLLLALVRSDGPAGRALRGLGLSVARVRAAIEQERTEQLARLGISYAPTTTAGSAGQAGFSERSARVFSASETGSPVETAILLSLLSEPSGHITELLSAAGVRGEDVRTKLSASASAASRPSIGHEASFFIPAPIDAVWGAVSDVERLPEWDFFVVDLKPEGDGWLGRQRGRKGGVRVLVERDECADDRVVWRYSFPELPHANERLISVQLSPADDGTRAVVTLNWLRSRSPRRLAKVLGPVLSRVLRPVQHRLVSLQVGNLGHGIAKEAQGVSGGISRSQESAEL